MLCLLSHAVSHAMSQCLTLYLTLHLKRLTLCLTAHEVLLLTG